MNKEQQELLDKAKRSGSINYDDISRLFPDTDPAREELTNLLDMYRIEINFEMSDTSTSSKNTHDRELDSDEDEELPDDYDDYEDEDEDEEDDDYEITEDDIAQQEKDIEDYEFENQDDSSFYTLNDEDLPDNFDNFDDILYSKASNSSQTIHVDDSVRMYLKEIGRVDLLTKEEEIEIAKVIADAKEFNDEFERKCNEGYVPTEAEIEENNQVKYKGELASKQLIEANLRLVVHIAKGFVASGMDFLDLIQEGSNGLAKAVTKFDYKRGNKFSTYATGWIKQSITRAIADQARTIRIPVHMNETINKLNRKERELTHQFGRKPTVDELADAMDLPVDKILMIKRVSQKTKSLEDPVGEEEDSSYGDFIPDDSNPNPEEYASNEALKKELNTLLSNLSDREERVIKLRFGLIDGRMRTLEEVGKEFGVTRERIRQIEAKALRKLRHPSRANKLKDFVK